MSAPVGLITRNLTVHFARSVSFPDQIPLVLQVEVKALASPSFLASNGPATFIDPAEVQQLTLSDTDNTVTFALVPTNLAGLSEPVPYRISWRAGGITGAITTTDFAMPDADVSFDQLANLDALIGGETYLQQSDLGVPGRVARLDDNGNVIDAAGIPVASGPAIDALNNKIIAEGVSRQQGDASTRTDLTALVQAQFNQAITTGQTNLASAKTNLLNLLSIEAQTRTNVDATETTARQNADNAEAAARQAADAAIEATLSVKADLDDTGHVPYAQIPPAAVTNWVPCADLDAMLALSFPSQIQPGDLALVGDPSAPLIYGLAGEDPSSLDDWILLNRVTSVNGGGGDVTVDLTSAATAGGAVPLDQVTGLSTALAGKAAASVGTQVAAILADTTYVHTSGGVIDHGLNDSRMAYVDATGMYVTRKDGVVLSGAGGSVGSVNGQTGDVVIDLSSASGEGGHITEAQVSGLTTALSAKADLVSGTVPLDQLPDLPTSQITGLDDILTENALTSSSNVVGRIAALEVGGGGGGGGGSPAKTTWFDGTTDFSNVANPAAFQTVDAVQLKGPWSINPSTGHYTYSPGGVAPVGDAYVMPYLTPNGHLQLRVWDESQPVDPALALESDLTTLSGTVSALSTTVSGKADQSALNTTNTTVAGKAAQTDLNATNATVATKADQSALDTTNATVSGITTALSTKADLSGGKLTASQIPTAIPQANVSGLTSSLAGKADLSGGVLAAGQIPTNIPQASVANLPTTLAAKADLVSGKLSASQIPTGIPQANVTNLTASLSAKADLVSGIVPTNQLPPTMVNPIPIVVANRSAMLALSTSAVAPGAIVVISATSDQGTYLLTTSDPTQFANWQLLVGTVPPVLTVNGQTATVVLGAADVGALASDASIPISQVSTLQTTLNGLATVTALNTGLAGKTSVSDVRAQLSSAVEFKQKANYVALSPVASLSGQQSADGVLMAPGAIVLLTAQSSSVQNGLWTVASGAWSRVADTASSSYLVKGTVVVIGAGATKANTLWQVSSASGVIDTDPNTWTMIGTVAPQYAPAGGNGINITGTAPAQTITAVAAAGGGCQVTGSGIGLDPAVAVRKVLLAVPAGSTTPTLTHNLNTTSPMVQIIEVASGNAVLVGWTATSANAVQPEFNTAPSANQYRAIIVG